MRVFVSEFICGGGLAGQPMPESLQREGWLMLSSIVEDLLRCPNVTVLTTIDGRLSDIARQRFAGQCLLETVKSPDDDGRLFEQLAGSADCTLVIAPETGNVLQDRVRAVESLGRRAINCSPESIDLCGDKFRLASHCNQHQIPTIPTWIADFNSDLESNLNVVKSPRCVVKPRDGAGSWLTFIVAENQQLVWESIARNYQDAQKLQEAVVQPYIAGRSLSVACLCREDRTVDFCPVGEQHLTAGLQYCGGEIPTALKDAEVEAIQMLVLQTVRTISGLTGWVGFDIILPDQSISEAAAPTPILVEVNPRLTTSYVGYRTLCEENLAERMLDIGTKDSLTWRSNRVSFSSLAPKS